MAGQTSRQDRGPIWIIVINHASPVYSRAAGPRKPRIMRSSATHVAGHPWGFRQAYRLAATVSHPLLLLQYYCSTQIHAYICPAGICRSRREGS
uniref:Uncharacterized protein n=1 Tax=Oryza punctata TaxID=4537 RepID=A0A0E0JLD8_ORYPU